MRRAIKRHLFAMHSYKASLGLWILLAVLALLLDSGIVLFTHDYKERLAKEVYTDAQYELNAHASALSSAIDSKLNLAKGIRAFVIDELEHSGTVSQSRFSTFSSAFMDGLPGIRNFSIYENGIASMVYPLEGNEVLLGLDLFHHRDPAVRENAERTKLTEELTILGPLELTQGGTGILSRQSVFWQGRFWGFVSVVLDVPPILEEAGLTSANKGIEFAVRAGGQVLIGSPEHFDHPSLYQAVSIPEGHWEIAAEPGAFRLDSVDSKVRLVQRICWSAMLLILIFLYTQFTQKAKLKQLVKLRTQKLEEANRELEVTYQELAATAYRDPVTGLLNRSSFNETLAVWMEEVRPPEARMALLYLDIDQFKLVNDTLGHVYGDLLLREIGDRLSGVLSQNQLLFRIGGDEFTILQRPIEGLDEARAFAQKVCDLFQEPFRLRDTEYFITASIGIAIYPEDGGDGASIVRNADVAMYRAKQEGKNQYRFFDTSLSTNTEEAMELAGQLRRALEKDEFFIHYQPQIEARTGKLTGLEALIRWQHPVRGLVPPGTFIPIAEETGLIVPIGEKVLHLVCAQSKIWQRAGLPPVRIAVNLSARQFAQKNFAARLGEILEEHEMEPRYIELEITENMAMKDDMQPVLQQLRDQGFTLSIDDFGTQYSSLNYLKKLPVQKIKIDRSFVTGISRDRKDEAIIAAMLHIADRLNLTVIAEGVETQEQLDFLKDNNCHSIQGYIFYKPQPAEEIEDLLKE
ncbi:putative bifunctional diguanylate cyclase/phosphodiesterase [Cohnella fermenti]|uniref:EAL domain-containing protein n=1 Tax=Cohnella fermenti TaxID=2565925 RepID=A0A4V3WGH2_9BACL|nr:EAL domain-containing protein [Cohnella fermenti]THF84239.1 EAL domain-containing protein [Cohnella fermenti]